MKHTRGYWKMLLALPLVIGVCGFCILAGESFLDSVFRCVTMYVMNYGDTPPNFLVEIARWTAPLATASSVVLVIGSLQKWLSARWKYLRGDSVAVYGPEQEKEVILAQLGNRGIDGGNTFLRARRYILLNEEGENFAFYQTHADVLRDSPVYIKCTSLPVQSVSTPNLRLFCPKGAAASVPMAGGRHGSVAATGGHNVSPGQAHQPPICPSVSGYGRDREEYGNGVE